MDVIQQVVSPLLAVSGLFIVAGSLLLYSVAPTSSTTTFASVMKSLVIGLILTTTGTGTYVIVDMSRDPDESEIMQAINSNLEERAAAEDAEGEQPNKIELDQIPQAPAIND